MFIRENKSPEGKFVEFLVFSAYENPLFLHEADDRQNYINHVVRLPE